MSLAASLESVAAVLAPCADVLAGRVSGPQPPDWCRVRGWERWLLDLSDGQLTALESAEGRRALDLLADGPADLALLARTAVEVESSLEASGPLGAGAPRPGMSPRKAGQVEALVRVAAGEFGDVRRVVDAGAGLGHLTRGLALALGVPVLGLEAVPERAARARDLSGQEDRVAFAAGEVGRAGLHAAPDSLLVGLHACGVLGDDLVAAAADSGAALLLVGCCLQRRSTPTREPLSRRGRELGLSFARPVLGLSNLVTRAHCVAGETSAVMAGRERRHALWLLLRGRGLDLEIGAEMRGLDRRHVARGLAYAAGRALARRGLAAADGEELSDAESRARAEFGSLRRLTVPRLVLGRLLELTVVLDRAQALAEAGHAVRVARVFETALSPRNLAVIAASRGPHAASPTADT